MENTNLKEQSLVDFINRLEDLKLYRQERVVRWQMREYMFESNDSTHQLYTTQIVLLLSELFCVSDSTTVKALKYACCHDYVESTEDSLGDINYMLKERNPVLKDIVKKQERIAMQSVEEFYKSMCDCENDEYANAIVKLADALEALLYVRREIRHNKQIEEWLQIETELMERIHKLWMKVFNLSNCS